MQKSVREPQFVFTEQDAAARSSIAAGFLIERSRLNQAVAAAGNSVVNRFYNLDHNAYLDGALPARTKELMGLSVSAALRCDDCINYHVIQSWRLGAPRTELEESLNVALVIGGSIVIPSLRRAYALLEQLYGAGSQA